MSRPIAELYLHYDIVELHVSLANGLWRYETWGYPVIDSAPGGAEVWAWFNNGTEGRRNPDPIDVQFKNLCATLSGLLCASLSFIDGTNTQEPRHSFRPQFHVPASKKSDMAVRYSNLPHEVVCTENLTPWKKLLPCGKDLGLLSLFNSDYVHSTSYHAIGIHIRQMESTRGGGSTLEVKQTANFVFDQIQIGGKDWSFRKLFGTGFQGACPLAETTKLYVDITEAKKSFDFTPDFDERIVSTRGGSDTEMGVFNLTPERSFTHLAAVRKPESKDAVPIIPPPPLTAMRFLLSVGQERGQIVTKLTNNHWSEVQVVLLENIPWFVPIYLHTLRVTTNKGVDIKPTAIVYRPGKQRERPYQLEVAVRLPSRSTVTVSIDFDYIFLKWQEYPPDANHGHYIGAATISTMLPVARNYTSIPIDGSLFADSFNATRSGYFLQIHTEALLLTLPTPDFSMPYNVICLTCTVVALAFGPIHSITTKKIAVTDRQASGGLVGRLKERLFGKRAKKAEEEAEKEDFEEVVDEMVEEEAPTDDVQHQAN